ncbi:SDR family NAD(P)-dependent oxidoreductase [Leucothrix arctica]|uniref:Short-chain dehydrogenase n=1 Tax=Leucothrix arctica TaxID=1481894 RepID=A0A317C9H9_9GAMM|nr:SDR family NAD(P)-dependent oxidoreductase [Leucothrix arctica]PWQ95355.1 short-chain dehydrogenase [Leucothrix arctica]
MKTVLITGATSGIGKQLALNYAKSDWHVVACGRNKGVLAELEANENISTLAFDISIPNEVVEASKKLEQPLDMLILNAGTCEYMDDVKHFDTEMFRRVVNSNLLGTSDCLSAFLPKVKDGGQLALMGSSASFFPFTRAQAYGASKAAIAYLAQTLAVDLAPQKIAVSLVSPGFVETALTAKNDFNMPMKISVEQASDEIQKGLAKRKLHVKTPRLFTFILGLVGKLPMSFQHWLSLRMGQS